MFSFIDPASSHAAALSHFHNYAMFFLILVIVFVVWLLKMILKFVVLERDLTQFLFNVESAKIPHIKHYGLWLLYETIASDKMRERFLDISLFLQITKDAKVAEGFDVSTGSSDLHWTLVEYPPQIFPVLVSTSNSVRDLYSDGNLVTIYRKSYKEYLSAVLRTFEDAAVTS